jgi:hypothetical protein
MPAKLPQWNLKHLAFLIALMAVGFGVFGVAGTVLLGAVFSPVILAPRGQRRSSFYWLLACYPLFFLLGVYLTWFSAWAQLGHIPVPNRNDPEVIVDTVVPLILTWLLLATSPFVLMIGGCMTVFRVVHPSRAELHWLDRSYPLFLYPLSWGVGYGVLRWDPLKVFHWFID